MKKKYETLIDQVRSKKPLVHHITNYVTANDCANITLAVGASPIMADALEEAADIARAASALVLNMGTLNRHTVLSMLAAGKAANKSGVPVIFDPVGAGASCLRNETAARILKEVKIGVLRGNISEIRFLAGLASAVRGVDASADDLDSSVDAAGVAKTLAARLNCVAAITGAIDVVSDGQTVISIRNGHLMLSNLTGTGCMCSSLIGSFCGAAPDAMLEATAGALLSMGIAGEIAWEQAGADGNGSFRMALHNAVGKLDRQKIAGRAKISET